MLRKILQMTWTLDINREMKSLYSRGNMLIRKFNFLPIDIKCSLFKTYCYSMYTCSLWSRYNQSTLYRLKVCYNSIMRRLAYVPPWHSARAMFVGLRVESFEETIRKSCYSLMTRVHESSNFILHTLYFSDINYVSSLTRHWHRALLPLWLIYIF